MILVRRLAMSSVLVLLAGLGGCGCLLVGDDGGEDDGPLAMDEGTAGGSAGEVCLEPPHCDPLAPMCGDGELCAPDGTQFSCVLVPAETMLAGMHEACALGGQGCDQGLVCLQVTVSGCDGPGCCIPLCDLEQPQCSGTDECMPFFTESVCYPEVGACAPA